MTTQNKATQINPYLSTRIYALLVLTHPLLLFSVFLLECLLSRASQPHYILLPAPRPRGCARLTTCPGVQHRDTPPISLHGRPLASKQQQTTHKGNLKRNERICRFAQSSARTSSTQRSPNTNTNLSTNHISRQAGISH